MEMEQKGITCRTSWGRGIKRADMRDATLPPPPPRTSLPSSCNVRPSVEVQGLSSAVRSVGRSVGHPRERFAGRPGRRRRRKMPV